MTSLNPTMLAELLRESLAKGHRPSLQVSSNSMMPLLKRGDEVVIESIAPAQLQPGDVITLINQATLLTHRFLEMSGTGKAQSLITRGDRPLALDPPAPTNALVGRVVGRSRNGKYLPLTAGAGKWLNRHLARLAQAEWNRLNRYNLPLPLFWRIMRRLLLLWGWLVTETINVWGNRTDTGHH